MRLISRLCLVFALIFPVAAPLGAAPGPELITLCYHEVLPAPSTMVPGDTMPVLVTELTEHFDWLRDNGYNVVSIDDVLRARKGGRPLPEKAVLLSFDDGYASFYLTVFPLLKAYGYTAMLALETTWLQTPAGSPVDYGGSTTLPRSNFLEWSQIKEMSDSGLVEIASHSHNLHRGHLSSSQGISQPAGASRAFNPKSGQYETWNAFYQRIRNDVSTSADLIYRHTGRRPRVMVWPYGRYTQAGVKASLDAGYSLTASLGFYDDGPTLPRFLMYAGVNLTEMMARIESGRAAGSTKYEGVNYDDHYPAPFEPYYPLQRVVHVDIDTVYDPDPEQQYKNISALFDRLNQLAVSVVYLQAYADPDGNGTTDALYFPNRHLPMRADLFNYLAWQMASRLGLEVYAWMPVMGFEIPGRPLVEAVSADKKGSVYDRLTPFDAGNRKIIKEIYQDLASHSIITGVIFHDDAVLGDYEDVSPAGRAWLRFMGLPEDPAAIHSDPEMMGRFTRAKSRYLIDFTKELEAAVESWSPRVKTVRNMYALVVEKPESEAWFAQNFDDFMAAYDYTGLMAMPYMEGAANPKKWLKRLAKKVQEHPLGARKTVFELQAVDWRANHLGPVPSSLLAEWMRLLRVNGIPHLGYYPENPINGHPDIDTIYPEFSLKENPFLMR